MVHEGPFAVTRAYRVHFDLVDKCILLRVNKRLKKPRVGVLFPIRPLILPYRRDFELAARYYFWPSRRGAGVKKIKPLNLFSNSG